MPHSAKAFSAEIAARHLMFARQPARFVKIDEKTTITELRGVVPYRAGWLEGHLTEADIPPPPDWEALQRAGWKTVALANLLFMRQVHAEYATPEDPEKLWVNESYITVGNPIRAAEVREGVEKGWLTLEDLGTSEAELANLCRLPSRQTEAER